MSKEGKVILSRVKSFVRHRVAKPIYEIETRTGRRIKVTGDHSLFSLDENGSLKAVKVSELKIKDRIVTPRFLPLNNKPIRKLNLFHHLGKIRNCYVVGDEIKNFVVKNKEVIKKIAISEGYPIGKGRRYPNVVEYWKRQGVLPASIFSRLLELKLKVPTRGVFIKGRGGSKSLPANISLDKSFLEFIGLWLADGCYDKDAIIISVVDDYTRKVVNDIAKRFGINVRLHSDGFSLVLSSRILKDVMTNVLELKGDSYTKRIPAWCFNLSQKQISYLLRGIFSGDGYLAKEEVGITLSSYNLIKDIQTLLLTFGIIGRVNRFRERDKTYSCRISGFEMLNKFYEKIGFIQNNFMEKLFLICSRHIYRRVTDTIPFSQHFKSEIAKRVPLFESHKYVVENCNMGKLGYEELLLEFGDFEPSLTQKIWTLINSDIFWDEIREIKVYEGENYVYDFSVEHTENFICENILAHNTLELSIPLMQKLGYNIERLKSRSVITRVETELPPDEVLRTALRLGESALIIGEVRSKEATALFEAMRIGALANVVAGTIHGESAYGVFDRVVYDLGVPPTSFKAIDLITICNMLRTPDGLHRFRRVTDLIEVRKHWKEDPLAEDGFVPLMEYSAKEDRLKPTETLLYGESEVLNAIAQRVREWRGAWDRVWDNILLRKRIRETLVEFAEKLKREDMLEAEFVAESNEAFHLICEQVVEEVGGLDSNLIYERWLNWLKNRVK
jgi:intein/homing endonuclease